MININELNSLSEQELDAIVTKINAIKIEKRRARIKPLIEHFKNIWFELEKEGVDICYSDSSDPNETLSLDSIIFDY
jgi:hypothetical protein